MTRPIAAIDIGTHTARLLIATDLPPSGTIKSLLRKRKYIRLAEDFDYSGKRIIHPESVDRTLKVLLNFLQDIKSFNVRSIHAIATGIVRDAKNRQDFLDRIHEETGIYVKLITGDEEALLTAKGVQHILGVQTRPLLIFDLGGGSTEFILVEDNRQIVKSIPLGAMVLTKRYLKSDPPESAHIDLLFEYIHTQLNESNPGLFRSTENIFIVGTGGTVTTLAMMLYGIEAKAVSAERINGLVLKKTQVETLFRNMKKMSFNERLRLPGLEKGRAEIILAGVIAVISILHFSKAFQLTVSMSDLLEGIVIENYKGESNDQ